MAIIHKGEHNLKKQARQYLLTSGICLGLIIAYAFVFINSGTDFAVHPAFHILPLLWLWGIFFYYRKYKNFLAGAIGENHLLTELRQLPNTYHIFTNFIIQEKGIRDEADFVVVGENGVFVIEAKNYCGQITGNADDLEWQQRKVAKGGKEVVKGILNPVKQATWHTLNMARLLKNHGFNLYVNAILAFTSPHVQLSIEANNLFIVHGCKKINAAILNYRPTKKLDKNMVKDIVRVLSTLK